MENKGLLIWKNIGKIIVQKFTISENYYWYHFQEGFALNNRNIIVLLSSGDKIANSDGLRLIKTIFSWTSHSLTPNSFWFWSKHCRCRIWHLLDHSFWYHKYGKLLHYLLCRGYVVLITCSTKNDMCLPKCSLYFYIKL